MALARPHNRPVPRNLYILREMEIAVSRFLERLLFWAQRMRDLGDPEKPVVQLHLDRGPVVAVHSVVLDPLTWMANTCIYS